VSAISSGSRGKTNGTQRESDRLRADIDATHHRLEGLLGELDRRRREALDVRLQMSRHPLVFVAGAALALGVLGGGTALAIARVRQQRRRRRSPATRLLRLWQLSSGRRAIGPAPSARLGWLAMRAANLAVAILVRQFARRTIARRRDD
jgi:hypothetical protein